MSNFQERVVKERNHLDLKVNGLAAFLYTETYNAIEEGDKRLLQVQFSSMKDYLQALDARIARFPTEEAGQ